MTVDFRHAPSDGWTLICRPDDPHKTLVREDGALLYDFDGRLVDVSGFDTIFEFSAATAHRPTAVEQRTESARRAIVHTTVRYPDQTLELIAFGHVEDGRRTDVVVWTITVAGHARDMLVALHIEAPMRGRGLAAATGDEPAHELLFVAFDAPVELPPDGVDGVARVTPAAEPTGPCALRAVPQPLVQTHAAGFRPISAVMTMPAQAKPGGSVSGALMVPRNHAETAAFDVAWAQRALDRERRYWDDVVLQPRALRVPDSGIQDMLVAASRNILQARELEDGFPVPQVGPTIYRGLWIVDGHFLLEAARYLGLDDSADAGLEVLLRRVRSDGSIGQMDDVPHIKETGIAIATLVRQAELSGDLDRMRRHWPVMRAAVAHIEQLRRQAAELPAEHPLHGLMPEAYGDGGLAGGARPEFTTALWTLVGLREAARAARLVEEIDDHARFTAAYSGLRDDFERAASKQRRPLPAGGRYLPIGPEPGGRHIYKVGAGELDTPRWRQIQPETATWALCHAIWPGEVFAPDETWVQDLLELYERRDGEQGIPATTGFQPYRAVWTYGASFAAHVWLYAGRPDKAVEYLYAFANHAFPTRVWREEQSLTAAASGRVTGDMPHNWASAEFIRLVRNLLVFERGDALELLAGAPAAWLAPGSIIELDRTPTRFGPVSLRVVCGERRLSIQVTLHASPLPAPQIVRLALERRPTELDLERDVPLALDVAR